MWLQEVARISNDVISNGQLTTMHEPQCTDT